MFGKTLIRQCWVWKLLVGGLVISEAIASFTISAFAQVTADPSLGTIVTPNGTTLEITGGITVGNTNLFHSFDNFSVPEGGIADFLNNNPTLSNIFARVTGELPSDIQGVIQAQGNANLFLINPNGIIFGENAQLDIGGSFVGTTANAIAFPNGAEFSMTSTASPDNPLLTVNPSALLFNQIAAQQPNSIKVEGNLAVEPNGSLLLVGGNVAPTATSTGQILVEGGSLNAPGGQVELGGLLEVGTVGLNVNGNNLSLNFPDGVARADVTLTNQAEVNVTAGGGGSISINARNLTMAGVSRIQAGIAPDLGSVDAQADNIEVNATGIISLTGGSSIDNSVQFRATGQAGDVIINADTVDFDGESSDFRASGVYSRIQEGASGQGGNIEIRARSLELTNGAIITASTRGQGNASDITIIADTVSFDGQGNFNPGLGFRQSSAAFSAVTEIGRGKGGNVSVTTNSLSLTNGGALIVDTLGQGTAGNVTINADTVSVDGQGTDSDFSASGIYSRVGEDAIGDGGTITVTARAVTLTNGGILSASTSGTGIGGTLTVNARSLSVRDGSEISATSANSGLGAGNLIVEDSDLVEVIGTSPDGSTPSQLLFNTSTPGDAGDLRINTRRLVVQEGAQVSAITTDAGRAGTLEVNASESIEVIDPSSQLIFDTKGTGDARGIRLETGELSVRDGGAVTVSSRGMGASGDLELVANSIFLNNEGKLQTTTQSGEGGNIRLQVQDLILMRYNSLISASAEGSGNGGNVEIEIPNGLVVAILSENSDIVASAGSGNGGKASATAAGVFGFRQFIDRRTPESDFTASSELGIDGVLDIDTQDRELEDLPADFLAADIAQGCQAVRGQAEDKFVLSGRGGLPPDSQEILRSEEPLVDLVTLDSEPEQRSTAVTDANLTPQTTKAIVEATRWVISPDGEVMLVASASAESNWATPVDCSVPSILK
ncbi:MAG: S-layer family protein [Coleofasciculaceae cyanobacterium]